MPMRMPRTYIMDITTLCEPAPSSSHATSRLYCRHNNPVRTYACWVTDTGNYRPIAVGEPLSRLYASILVQRLVHFTEQHDLRSPTQAAYRPEHSTILQAFVLQHDKHRCLKTPLYLCFVDLKSAYDRVQWPLLWGLLQRLGVQGKMSGAVQSSYDNCLLSMRVSGISWGEGQNPLYGVAAGLSAQRYPFGLFIDGLHHYLEMWFLLLEFRI